MYTAHAQPTLPNILCAQEGSAVRLTWVCQYEGIKAVVVRRSYDSLRNYYDIGSVADVRKGAQTYIDEHPVHGRCFYKVTVIFKSGLNWSSNHCGITNDGTWTPDTLRPNTGETVMPRIKFKLSVPEIDLDASYVDPIYVRTNKTTGHVDVRLPHDFVGHTWSLVFYDNRKQQVMNIPAVKAKNIVIDKRNFRQRGQYKFELRRDGILFEWGYVAVN